MLRFSSHPLLLLFLGSLLISLFAAAVLPITLDEAYYAAWGQKLSFGYFDHPPGVAFLSSISSLFSSRLGALILGIASLTLAARLFWITGNKDWKTWILALVLFKFNVASLASGILTTPDCFLVFFWLLALHEAYIATSKAPRRWLSAGLATGLGLLSKYNMVLIGPIFLIALLKKPQGLRKPWPYLGGILAFLILLPNLYWNSQNGWPTLVFQLRRLVVSEIQERSDLPKPTASQPNSSEDILAHSLVDTSTPELPPIKKPSFQIPPTLAQFLEYLGGLLVLWGLLLIPLFGFIRKSNRRKGSSSPLFLNSDAKVLFSAALWVPIVFYGILSFFTKIEANWSAIYMLAAAPILAPYLMYIRRGIYIASFTNCIAILLIALHARSPFIPLKHDRILKETFGFEALSKHIELLPGPIFADTYQLTSMLRFYQKNHFIMQWPGMNRPSEFTHNPHYAMTLAELKAHKKFWLLSSDSEAPHLDSFKAVYMERIKDCRDGNLVQISSREKNPSESFRCPSVHSWSLIEYASQD